MEANVPIHPNIQWIQWDISNRDTLEETTRYIYSQGGADYVIHLAGYYDFDYEDKPEYKKTNIKGTKNILEVARDLRVKRFLFASSLAACNFPERGDVITEKSPVDADFAYARSKKRGEIMVNQYSKYYPCSVIRFAAVYSDWCEYAPLYKFLSTWLSGQWNSKILGGKGQSAITYIHIHDLKELLITIIKKSRFLPQFDTYIASPDGCVSHKELFHHATRDFFGKPGKPFFAPRWISYLGIHFMSIFSRMKLIPQPFEKPWMIKYIDEKLVIDSSYTREVLGWHPIPRYHILRRLLFLLVNLKAYPSEWNVKNEAALEHIGSRANLIIYEKLMSDKEHLLKLIIETVTLNDNIDTFGRFQEMTITDLKSQINTIYNLLLATVRSGDRSLMLKYLDDIGFDNFAAGFEVEEIIEFLKAINRLVVTSLQQHDELENLKQEIHDYIALAFQLAQDEIEEIFEELEKKFPQRDLIKKVSKPEVDKRDKLILKLSRPYQVYSSEEEKSKDYRDKHAKFSMYDMR